MEKVIVEFLKTHGRYVKGDVAGFTAETVAARPKGVCKPHDPNAKAGIVALSVDTSAAQKMIEHARAEIEAKGGELDTREADLKAREDALAQREAELAASVSAEPTAENTEDTAKSPSGEPPKQGAKK